MCSTSNARVLFIASDGDRKEIKAIRSLMRSKLPVGILIVDPHPHGDYAFKINRGVLATGEPWIFQAADDLRFHDGWLDEAVRVAGLNGARVIGTDDRCNPRVRSGRHSTHSLVARSYVEEVGTGDRPGHMLHEGYEHGFVDDELVWIARRRGEFAFSYGSVVEHLHPRNRQEQIALDATYEKALDGRAHARDRALFRRRQRLVDPRIRRRQRSSV